MAARARSEGKRPLKVGVRSVWASASLAGRHVGHAGVGVVCLRGAPISLPTVATVGILLVAGGRVVGGGVWLSGSLN